MVFALITLTLNQKSELFNKPNEKLLTIVKVVS